MIPDRKEAKRLLAEAETHNPGAWARHSEFVPPILFPFRGLKIISEILM